MGHSQALLVSVVDNCEQDFGNVQNPGVRIGWNARRASLFAVRNVVMSNAFRIDSMTRCAKAQW